jgi:hypothetical protein
MNREPEDDFAPISEWLRSERAPFGQEDFAAMRRGVWREIEARRERQYAFRPGRLLAGGAMLAAAFVAVLWLRPASEGRSVTPPAFDRVPVISTDGTFRGQGDVDDFRRPFPATPRSSTVPRPRSHAGAQPGALPTRDAPVKIEFQTANPDVRIIWLVKKDEAPPRSIPASRIEEVS